MNHLRVSTKSYIAVAVTYVVFILLLPADRYALRQYHLSSIEYHILLLLITLPLLGVWYCGFYGYALLERYVDRIHGTPEAASFEQLARGCKWLAWSMPITASLSLILGAIVNVHSHFQAADSIILTYSNLLLPGFAYIFLSNSSRRLTDIAKIRFTIAGLRAIVGFFVILGVMFCYLTFRQLHLASTTSTQNPFYLPNWLMVVTVTIPFLFAWFIGLLAAYEFALYGQRSHGVLFRQPMRLVAAGIGLIIAGSIALQYVTSVEPRSAHLTLNSLLLLTYAFRFIQAAGFLCIGIGATKLRRIEEV